MSVKQIDYLKLVSTGKRSSYYAKPTEADEALKNLILFAGTASLGLTFAMAVFVSWRGTELVATDVGQAPE